MGVGRSPTGGDVSHTLILLRHGESLWNAENLFTGWWDVDLSEKGEREATRGGELLAENELLPDVVHTSVQKRAIRTANLALDACDRAWIPVRRSWRLNERHYGALTGLDKKQTVAEHGPEQVHLWRRSYDTPPPPIEPGSRYDVAGDPRYADLPPEAVPRSECLEDVLVRALPYWVDGIAPDLRAGRVTLIAAHGNSLRALVKHLDDISDDEIAELNIPTGNPLVYELGDDLRPAAPSRYLDPEAAAAGVAAVKAQTG
jgi:2,3-bisphosphoglycerate-dependent phosphoglycerate mutase